LRETSSDDALTVERFACQLSLPLDVIRVDVDEWRAAIGQGVEAAARAARYAALARVADAWGTGWIAVGHTLDDQAETVLLRLARGSGLDGLSGMRTRSSRSVPLDPAGSRQATIMIIRPLLGVRRSEIEAYAAEHGLVPVEDESNVDPRFRRNAIRHEVIPALERIVPGARASIARNAELLADDADLLNELATAAITRCCRTAGNAIRLDRSAFRAEPPALQRRMVRLAIQTVAGEIELSRERIEAVRTAALRGVVAKRIEIGRGFSALVERDVVLIGPDDRLEP
jgi:tRNA(Ile)-lysidine synthetase-like protein